MEKTGNHPIHSHSTIFPHMGYHSITFKKSQAYNKIIHDLR